MERVVYGSISWGADLQICTLLIGPCTTCHGLSRRTCVTGCYKSQPGVSPLSLSSPYWRYPRVMCECGCIGARCRHKYKMKSITWVLEFFPRTWAPKNRRLYLQLCINVPCDFKSFYSITVERECDDYKFSKCYDSFCFTNIFIFTSYIEWHMIFFETI